MPDISMTRCTLCPRGCRVDRTLSPGYCGGGGTVRVARAARHDWEEPCISGTKGSGCVFFGGCSLRCVYCQNYGISVENGGIPVTVERLAGIFRELEASGVHNLNMVTGTHYAPWIRAALDMAKPSVPVVWNTGGYETLEAVDALAGYVQVYLPDLKYRDAERGERYSRAPDYWDAAIAAIRRMYQQVGPVVMGEDGLIRSGVIVRHMVLPHGKADSLAVLEGLAEAVPPKDIRLSVLRQYTPCGRAEDFPEIDRRVSTYEYNAVVDRANALGFDGFLQERSSAEKEFTPPFDGTGVL